MSLAPGTDLEGAELPWIGLVTPSFNQAQYLPQALDSVLDQGYPNLRYHVQDAGSTDGSLAVLERYASRLSSWETAPDSGQYDGLNRGFHHLLADPQLEILGWLNADDLLLPAALHSVGEIFAQFPQVAWITCLVRLSCDHTGRIDGTSSLPGLSALAFQEQRYLPSADPLRAYDFLQQESTFWRRSLWQAAGGLRTDCGMAGDYALWQRFFQLAPGAGVAVPLALNRRQHRQQSSAIGTYTEQALKACHHKGTTSLRFRLRSLVLRIGLQRLPAISRRLPRILGYNGFRIVRVNPQGPNSSWSLDAEVFL
jgi:glycosyltransferase involved in cell wall biosynthesis